MFKQQQLDEEKRQREVQEIADFEAALKLAEQFEQEQEASVKRGRQGKAQAVPAQHLMSGTIPSLDLLACPFIFFT